MKVFRNNKREILIDERRPEGRMTGLEHLTQEAIENRKTAAMEGVQGKIAETKEIRDGKENSEVSTIELPDNTYIERTSRSALLEGSFLLDYEDEDGISNRERIAHNLSPLDEKTGQPLELHHIGQEADSPLVELTRDEHRTGEYEEASGMVYQTTPNTEPKIIAASLEAYILQRMG